MNNADLQTLTPSYSPKHQENQTPDKPLVIVMHASVGSGHRSAANAIAQAFELIKEETNNTSENDALCSNGKLIPDDLEIQVLDVLDFGRIIFDGDKTAAMFTGSTRPIYDLSWRFTLTGRLLWGGGSAWSRIMFPAFTDYVKKKKPLAIVCTHITAANVAVGARMLTNQSFPVVCVPTDYEIEGWWPHQHADLFCVTDESMAETLRPRKVPESRILITGIPTREDFRKTHNRAATRKKMGLPENATIVTALAGAYLPRPYVHFRSTLDTLLPRLNGKLKPLHFVFVAGKDSDYEKHLRTNCEELGIENSTVLGYVDDMAALMSASDLAICKAGGLTVTECLCAQVPMVLVGRAYGQEKANVRMLTASGAALHVTTPRELENVLYHATYDPASTRSLLANGRLLRRPNAARDIATATLRLAHDSAEDNNQKLFSRKCFVQFYWGQKPAHTR